jgi:beta-galactosidase
MADITSYDYDAPLSEPGDLTPKYYILRSVIGDVRYKIFFHLHKILPM